MRRLLSLLLMTMLVIAPGSAAAAAICMHEDRAAHEAGLADEADGGLAQREDAAGQSAAKRGLAMDAGAFAFSGILPPATTAPAAMTPAAPAPLRPGNAVAPQGRAIAPLLEPPAA